MEDKSKRYLFWAPPLLRALGIAMLVFAIVVMAPLAIPQVFGMQVYSIISGSMEPEIPVGSVVYVQHENPSSLEAGEVIAYSRDDVVVVHRVETNQSVEGRLITKGDANEDADVNPVNYDQVLGKVAFHIPILGAFADFLSGWVGKAYAACFILAGVLFCILANQITTKRKLYEMTLGQ